MTVWLICLPVFIVVVLATRVVLRTRSGAAMRVFLAFNVVLAVARACVLAVTADPVAAPQAAVSPKTPRRARRTGRRCSVPRSPWPARRSARRSPSPTRALLRWQP